MRRMTPAVVVAAALGITGCYWQVMLNTVIAPDGTTERAVSVLGNEVHEVADQFETPAAAQGWTTREVAKDSYDVRGVFKSPATMPSGYVRRLKDAGETAPSRIEWQAHDRVFYTLYEYKETITDVVTSDRFDSAARELIDVGLDLACLMVEKRLADTYDVSRLTAFVRREGRPLLTSVAWAWYVNGPEVLSDSSAVRRALAPILKQHGLDVDVAGLWDGGDTAGRQLLLSIAGDRVRLKRAKDRPLTEKERLDLVAAFTSKEAEEASAPAIEGYMAKRYGGKDAADRKTACLAASVLGAYTAIMAPEYRFHAMLKMPGRILRTTGTLLGDSEVVWEFRGSEVFPRGYVMSATSVVFNEKAQRAVAGKPFLTTLADVAVLDLFVAGSDTTRALLADCVKARSLAPLDKVAAAQEAGAAVKEAAQAIKRMIGSASGPGP